MQLCRRLRYHFQFQNELNYSPKWATRNYSVNIYGPMAAPLFLSISNLFHPVTVDACLAHDGCRELWRREDRR